MQGYQPQIPQPQMRPMTHITRTQGGHDPERGGQWIPGAEVPRRITGAILPLSDKDLQTAPPGTYTKDTRKLYTAAAVEIGDEVKTQTGERYQVSGDLDHGAIHPMRRYVLQRAGAAHG